MAAHVRASLRAILLLVRAEVVRLAQLDESRVLVVAVDPADVEHMAAEQDVLIRVLGERPVGEIPVATGRVDDRRMRTIEFTVRTRLYLDASDWDLNRLTDLTLGHLALEDKVYDAVKCFMPADAADNVLAVGGHPQEVSAPAREPDDPAWLTSSFEVEFEYTRDLDQARQ